MPNDYGIAVESEPKSSDSASITTSRTRLIGTAVLWGAANFVLGLLSVYLLHQLLPDSPGAMAAVNRVFRTGNLVVISISTLIWAPLYETVIGQLLPVELLRRLNVPRPVILIACGAIFGIGHYFNNGLIHGLRTVVAGILLGELYCRYREQSLARSYLAVVIAHAFTNLCVLIAVAFGGG